MSLKTLHIRNFRGFRDAAIHLKPLTVLLGPNSAGKSSFGHALAAMGHAHRTYAGTPVASLTPASVDDQEAWPVDLGTIKDLRTQGASGPVKVALTMPGGSTFELGFGGLSHSDQLLLTYASYPLTEPNSAQTSIQFPTEATSAAGPATSQTVQLRVVTEVPTDSRLQIEKINELEWKEGENFVSVIPDGLIIKAVQRLTGTQRPLSTAAIDELRALFMNMAYLRANRKRPSRGYADGIAKGQPIGYSGEFTPTVYSRNASVPVEYFLPPASDGDSTTGDWRRNQETLGKAVADWLNELGLAEGVSVEPSGRPDTRQRLCVTLHEKTRDITEVGFGVSQVIPILVTGLLQPNGSLLIVDLPEGHLHPRPQGAIADFFCSMVLAGRNCLVETHSEMFFHQLRLRAAMNPALRDQIAVYFIDPPQEGDCSRPRSVGLGFEDELKWPPGFLQEGWDIERKIQLVRKRKPND